MEWSATDAPPAQKLQKGEVSHEYGTYYFFLMLLIYFSSKANIWWKWEGWGSWDGPAPAFPYLSLALVFRTEETLRWWDEGEIWHKWKWKWEYTVFLMVQKIDFIKVRAEACRFFWWKALKTTVGHMLCAHRQLYKQIPTAKNTLVFRFFVVVLNELIGSHLLVVYGFFGEVAQRSKTGRLNPLNATES